MNQMGTAAVLPRLFHDWIPNNKSALNAKMNTCKNSNCSTEALTCFLVLIYSAKHFTISSALIRRDLRRRSSKLLHYASIDLRPAKHFLKRECVLFGSPLCAGEVMDMSP